MALLLAYFGMQSGLSLHMKLVMSSTVISKDLHLLGIPAPFLVTGIQQLVILVPMALWSLLRAFAPSGRVGWWPRPLSTRGERTAVLCATGGQLPPLSLCLTWKRGRGAWGKGAQSPDGVDRPTIPPGSATQSPCLGRENRCNQRCLMKGSWVSRSRADPADRPCRSSGSARAPEIRLRLIEQRRLHHRSILVEIREPGRVLGRTSPPDSGALFPHPSRRLAEGPLQS